MLVFLFLFSQNLVLFRTGVGEERACKATKDSTAMQSSAYAKWISFSCIVPLACQWCSDEKDWWWKLFSCFLYCAGSEDGFSTANLLALHDPDQGFI